MCPFPQKAGIAPDPIRSQEALTVLAWQAWLVLGVALAIGELVTGGFFLLWFAIGAVVGAAAAALGLGLVGQLLVFLSVSALLIAFTRPLVHRLIERRRPAYQTNANALVGKPGTVVRQVDPLEVSGQVKVGGEIWTAVTAGAPIPKGAMVIVERVDGVKLRVRPVEDR
jgi:membrane protein implicated in regulation of membrane protease activity